MKTLISGSILLVVALFVSSCTDTNEAAEPTISALKTTETETVETTEDTTATEVSEADLRDPVKQYKRYRKLSDIAWDKNPPSIDESELLQVATESFADALLASHLNAKTEGYYYENPEGYEEFMIGDIKYSQQFFTKDENDISIFSEGSTVRITTCEVDDSITKDSKTGSTLNTEEDNLITYENLVQMNFRDGMWKINGLNNVKELNGVVECKF